MILPPSNSSSSVTLETIGQASTHPTHPFGSIQLSPKVVYREIATSDQVRDSAASSMGMTPKQFGTVRIKLIDETSLMLFQIGGRTPEQAQEKGRAVMAAFNAQLDALRRDEVEKRASLMRDSLKLYQANLEKARERILEFQRETGLQSIAQFNEASSTAEQLRRKLAEKRSEFDKARAEQVRLIARVGFGPKAAALGLRLASDTAFTRLAATFAEGHAAVHENALRLGPKHPVQIAAELKRSGALAEIEKIANRVGRDRSVDLQQLVLFVNASHQSELLRAIVAGEAALNGLETEIPALAHETQRLEAVVARMGELAGRLEALKKDHLLAEAVYTSAAARLDTNRADLLSSYPLVQLLAEPGLPDSRTQPRLSYALAAGMAGTAFVLLAWVASWAGTRLKRKGPLPAPSPGRPRKPNAFIA